MLGGGEKRKCDRCESCCECVWRQRDTGVTLSESQTANYKTQRPPLPLSPLLPSSFPASLPACLRLHHSHTCSVFIGVSKPPHLSIWIRTSTSLENPSGGKTGKGEGEERQRRKGRVGDESSEGRLKV